MKERAEKEVNKEALNDNVNISNSAGRSGNSERREDSEPDVNSEHLRQLMDMGFSRAHCIEALLHTLTVEQATDYLLTNPATLRRSVS